MTGEHHWDGSDSGSYRRRGQPDGDTAALYTMLAVGTAVIVFGLTMITVKIGENAIPMWIAVVAGATIVLRGALGRALADRIAGRTVRPAEVAPETLAELDDLRTRVGELEERLDFSERLLAQQRDRTGAPDA